MSDFPPWTYRGAFIPYFRPTPAILTDPLSAQDAGICFHTDWTPAVIGALKVLCRPETWTGSDDDIKAAMLNAQTLIAAIQDGCTSGGFPFACPYDITSTDAGATFVNSPGAIPPNRGDWVSGVGFETTVSFQSSTSYCLSWLGAIITFASAIAVTDVTMTYDLTKGTGLPSGFSNGLQLFHGGVLQGQNIIDSHLDPDGTGKTRTAHLSSSTVIDEIDIFLVTYYDPACSGFGYGKVTNVLVQGTGVGPPGCS